MPLDTSVDFSKVDILKLLNVWIPLFFSHVMHMSGLIFILYYSCFHLICLLQSFVSMENTHLLIRGLCQWKNDYIVNRNWSSHIFVILFAGSSQWSL